MHKFKAGDKIRRTYKTSSSYTKGGIYEVEGYNALGHLLIRDGDSTLESYFELVEPALTEQEQRKAAADRVRAAIVELNTAVLEASRLDLQATLYWELANRSVKVFSITYKKTITEEY